VVARRHGIRLGGSARQVRGKDFREFDLIVAMDGENLRALVELRGDALGGAELALLRDYDPAAGGDLDVPDPYYGGPDGFERVFEMVRRSCVRLLDLLEERASP